MRKSAKRRECICEKSDLHEGAKLATEAIDEVVVRSLRDRYAVMGRSQEMTNSIKTLWLAGLCLHALTGCDKAPTTDADLIRQGEEAARQELFDPESGRFRGTRVNETILGKYVCGELNGKNRFGGYGGFRRFYAEPPNKDRNSWHVVADSLGGSAADREGYDYLFKFHCESN